MNADSQSVWPSSLQMNLLKAALLKGPLRQKGWDEWSSQIDFEQIDPASYKLLPLLVRNQGEEGPIFEKSKGVYRKTWVENQLAWNRALPLFEELGRRGVERIVILKGMGMILSCYRDFGMRVMGDIDFLIEKKEVPKVHDFLFAKGWVPSLSRFDPRNEDHLLRYHALNFSHPEGGKLDLHWSFIQEQGAALNGAVFQAALPFLAPPLYLPLSTDLLLQTLIHGVKYSPVPLIRWIGDAFYLVKKGGIDWDRFCSLAEEIRIVYPILLGLEYLAAHFDANIPTFALERLRACRSLRVERLESWLYLHGYPKGGDWCRFCIQRGYFSIGAQIAHLPRYWQMTARLPSLWHIPFYAPYWIGKRLKKKIGRK